ncbi:tlde1 domain-containing protein [uncultured Methylobacterium sp.]|uniref:DUF2778 domain-containing protein n=1 Tax=uncultured Methylobacterium sp. TaxID=157278 RepID=UPI0035CB587D
MLFCLATLGGVPPTEDAKPVPVRPQAQDADATASSARYAALFDRRPMLDPDARTAGQGAPLGAAFQAAVAPPAIPAAAQTVKQALVVPLPVPRPAAFVAPASAEPPAPRRLALRRAPPRTRAVLPAPTAETPSFFEELFAARKEPGPALAYAALGNDSLERSRGRLIPAPEAIVGTGTAIYDISARTVRLPSGEVLEAHSGLGGSMDDPRSAHLRMRGPTPPGSYDLTEREQLFHGVRALRLTPVGGSAAIHGRDGILAHTYMLGPSGASNGCVVFRNYDRFLQAYLRGEVRRLIVVSGRWQDGPPRFADER